MVTPMNITDGTLPGCGTAAAIVPAGSSLRWPARRLGADQRGVTAVTFGLLLVPILVSVGAGVDLTRDTTFRTALQSAADSAAIAGAAAYVDASSASKAVSVATAYIQQAEAGLPANNGVTFSVTTKVLTNTSGQTTGYTVSVSASGSVATTLMSVAMSSMPNSVSATALDPMVTINATLGNWKSSAWDANTIYWYIVPSNGSLPKTSDLHALFTNTSKPPTSLPPISLTAGQTIGFALKNVTGGLHPYGSNGYGSPQGHANWLYSQLSPPSLSAYPTEANNCALQVVAATASDPTPTETPGSCSPKTPAFGTVSCNEAAGQTIFYFWNDMGGGTDDYDYNDAQYSLTCSGSSSGSLLASNGSNATTVVLIR
jgi:Flp pilus assembly protein TadG